MNIDMSKAREIYNEFKDFPLTAIDYELGRDVPGFRDLTKDEKDEIFIELGEKEEVEERKSIVEEAKIEVKVPRIEEEREEKPHNTIEKDGKVYVELKQPLSEELMNKYIFIAVRETQDIYVYTKEGYYQNARVFVEEKAKELVGEEEITDYQVSKIITNIRASNYKSEEELNPPLLLNLKNGVLNLSNREFYPHSPIYYFTYQVDVEYNPKAECDKFDKFLSEVIDERDVDSIYEFIGQCLLPDNKYQIIFFLTGGGRNGKGVLVKVMEEFFGKTSCVSASPTALRLDNNKLLKLRNKKLWIAPEVVIDKRDGELVKRITGGDTLSGRAAYKLELEEFVFYGNVVMQSNEPLKPYEDTVAAYSRFKIINFPITFDGIDGNPEPDRNLREKLITPNELSGILNKALNGVERLRKNKDYSSKQTHEDIKRIIEMSKDPLEYFINERYILVPNEEVERNEVFIEFDLWRKKNQLTFWSDKKLASELQR